jgi:hypothetical protein
MRYKIVGQSLTYLKVHYVSKCWCDIFVFSIEGTYDRYQSFAGAGTNLNEGDASSNNVKNLYSFSYCIA